MSAVTLWVNMLMLCLTEIFGDFQLKFFARGGGLPNLGGGLLGYFGVIYFAIKCFRMSNVSYVNAIWDGASVILESLAAYLILGERLSNWHQYAGLLLIIGGIFLMRIGKIPY